jgi:uncharacterized Ntn-hydrolase superfamily protein
MTAILTSTYSIVGVDPDRGWLGSAVASCALAVGSGVPHVRQNVGAVNTQHYANPRMAEEVLTRMTGGMAPGDALKEVLRDDPAAGNRQFVAISLGGATATWTGSKCQMPHSHREGASCVAAGNRLGSSSVIDAMVTAFESSEGKIFAERLLLALEAGERQGGDALGHESAALLVVPRRTREEWPLNLVDLRVDHHPNPVSELRRIYGVFAARHKGYDQAP